RRRAWGGSVAEAVKCGWRRKLRQLLSWRYWLTGGRKKEGGPRAALSRLTPLHSLLFTCSPLLATRRLHLVGADGPGLVAPRRALVVCDVGDVGIVQRGGERRHRAGVAGAVDGLAVQAVEDRGDLLGGVVVEHRGVVLERREGAGQAHAGGLVAGRAIGGIE